MNPTNIEKSMQKSFITKPQMLLVGITVRTNNEQEADKTKGKISPCVQKYFHQGLFEKIPNRKKPGVTICAYTQYESDFRGDYTYFIGEEVSSFDVPIEEEFQKLVVPEQKYAKFTTEPGPMPDVLINAWKEIWEMTPEQLGGKRRYETDFEVYDERALDHANVVLDVLIGIES